MFFHIKDDEKTSETNQTFVLYNMDSEDKTIVTPPIKYATVHLSRVFGVSDDCVFATSKHFSRYIRLLCLNANLYNH